jgi:hypothetical protein
MIDRFFRLLSDFVYAGFSRERELERKAAAAAFTEMRARREREFAERVLTGR